MPIQMLCLKGASESSPPQQQPENTHTYKHTHTHTHTHTCDEINANKHVNFLRREQYLHKGNESYPGVSLQDGFPERSEIPLGKQHSTTWHDLPLRQKNGILNQGKDIRIWRNTVEQHTVELAHVPEDSCRTYSETT